MDGGGGEDEGVVNLGFTGLPSSKLSCVKGKMGLGVSVSRISSPQGRCLSAVVFQE